MILQKRHFICTDVEKNSNKFWIIELYNDYKVITRYGRVGVTGEITEKQFSSALKAESFFNSKIRDKLKVKEGRRDSYTEITLANDSIVHSSKASAHLPDLAVQQIQTSSEEIRKLIRWLAEINIHNIISNTTIKYNANEGCFKTPLGVVDRNCIDQAKSLLKEIFKYSKNNDLSNKECIKHINSYLRYIPQDLGGSHVKIYIKDVFGTSDLLSKQESIIEGLEASLATPVKIQSEEVQEKIFNVEMEPAGNCDLVFTLFGNPGYTIANIYAIKIKSVYDAYNTSGKNVGNERHLFHGTNPANLLSIFKQGLIIRESVNGSRFGRGLYFSDKSSMSLGYANSNRRNNLDTKFIFVSQVAMGKVFYGGGSSLSDDHNSRWAEKESSSSQIIVYNTKQVDLQYLLEITRS